MKIKLGFRKLFKKEKDPAPAYSGSVDDLKDSISPPTPIPPSPSQSSPSASISVKDFKRRSSSELLKQPAGASVTPPFKTRRKPPPNPNLSSWHSSDESDDVRDNDFEKFKSRIRQTRETAQTAQTVQTAQTPNTRLSAMRKANTELALSDSDSDDDGDDTLPLSQLRSKSQVSLVNSVASKPNKSTPSLKLQGSSHKLNYRKPPAPASVRESRQSRDIKVCAASWIDCYSSQMLTALLHPLTHLSLPQLPAPVACQLLPTVAAEPRHPPSPTVARHVHAQRSRRVRQLLQPIHERCAWWYAWRCSRYAQHTRHGYARHVRCSRCAGCARHVLLPIPSSTVSDEPPYAPTVRAEQQQR